MKGLGCVGCVLLLNDSLISRKIESLVAMVHHQTVKALRHMEIRLNSLWQLENSIPGSTRASISIASIVISI